MSMIQKFLILCVLALPLPASKILAEPWVSNRYAQNCAACHAPGRYNLKASERRCTLSCQGCHVNPNGGGIRNQYGVWNQQRWLRSFYSDTLRNKYTPAPLKDQKYAKSSVQEKDDETPRSQSERGKKGKKADRVARSKADVTPEKSASILNTDKEVPTTVLSRTLNPRLKDYDRSDYNEWKTEVDKEAFLKSIPEEDPYRLERREWIYAGGDIRYIYGNVDRDGTKTDLSFPMSVDMGIRFRPVREKISLVLESRFFNTPANKDLEDAVTTSSQVRSAYFIADDLWFNTWFMAGLYRPMFGNYVPDHNSLAQELSFGSSSYRVLYKAAGLGGSPNVPYFNIHAITPIANSTSFQDTGFVANLGARAVTKSLSANLSYWNTTNETSGQKLIKQMISVSGGGMLGPVIANAEWLRIEEEFAPGKKDGGNVVTLDLKAKLWRENYFPFGYAYSNVSRSPRLSVGKSSEVFLGFKSFLLSGMELELLGIDRSNESNGVKTKEKVLQLQAHLFF